MCSLKTGPKKEELAVMYYSIEPYKSIIETFDFISSNQDMGSASLVPQHTDKHLIVSINIPIIPDDE